MTTIHRRQAIKKVLFISAGVVLIPACMQDRNKATVILKNVEINGHQEKLLAELCETIIPVTDTPGAKDISAHLFVLKMLDDCYSKEDQQKFIKGMEAFNAACKTQFGDYFSICSPEQRTTFLQQAEKEKDRDSDLNFFYNMTKRLTIQAYTSSKFYLTKINVYKMVPGRYHGCVPIKTTV